MTPEDQAQEGIRQAKAVAEQMAIAMHENTDNAKVAVYASAIAFAGICAMQGVGLHTAINLFMSIYKQIDEQDLDGFIQ